MDEDHDSLWASKVRQYALVIHRGFRARTVTAFIWVIKLYQLLTFLTHATIDFKIRVISKEEPCTHYKNK